jgi:hypothetical protein
MSKPKLVVKGDLDEYATCNFCLSKIEVYDVKGDRLTSIVSICKECVDNIYIIVNKL